MYSVGSFSCKFPHNFCTFCSPKLKWNPMTIKVHCVTKKNYSPRYQILPLRTQQKLLITKPASLCIISPRLFQSYDSVPKRENLRNELYNNTQVNTYRITRKSRVAWGRISWVWHSVKVKNISEGVSAEHKQFPQENTIIAGAHNSTARERETASVQRART